MNKNGNNNSNNSQNDDNNVNNSYYTGCCNQGCDEVGDCDHDRSSSNINFEANDSWKDGDKNPFNFTSIGIKVTVIDGIHVNWEVIDQKFGINAVIGKGGSNPAKVYLYDPLTFNDIGLTPPNNDGNNIAGLSNLTFCWYSDNVPTGGGDEGTGNGENPGGGDETSGDDENPGDENNPLDDLEPIDPILPPVKPINPGDPGTPATPTTPVAAAGTPTITAEAAALPIPLTAEEATAVLIPVTGVELDAGMWQQLVRNLGLFFFGTALLIEGLQRKNKR